MPKKQCLFPGDLDVLDIERKTDEVIEGDVFDVVETAITNIEKYVVFSKFDAVIGPTIDNDYDEGYRVGSRWVDTVLQEEFICIDPTNGVAVWMETTFKTEEVHAITFHVKAGEDIKKGQALSILGAFGNNPVVHLADNTDPAHYRVVGLAVTDILNNADGFVIRYGSLLQCDTRQGQDINADAEDWAASDLLYSTSSGKLTKIRPTSGRIVKAAYSLKGSGATDVLLSYPMENPVWIKGAAGEDVILGLGDDVGVNKVSIRNFNNDEVATIDSYGVITIKTIVPEDEVDFGEHSVGFTIQSLTGDGTDEIDWKKGNYMKFTCPAGDEVFTFLPPSNPCGLTLQIKQDGVGGRDITLPGNVKWLGAEPTWSDGGADKTIIMSMRYDGTDYWAQATEWET